MKKTRKKPITAEAIARLADQGKDISGFFEGKGRMVHPVQRVNVDLTAAMLDELDQAARNPAATAQSRKLVQRGSLSMSTAKTASRRNAAVPHDPELGPIARPSVASR